MEDELVRVSRKKGDPTNGDTDWEYLRAIDNGEIKQEEDPENPFWTENTRVRRATTGQSLPND